MLLRDLFHSAWSGLLLVGGGVLVGGAVLSGCTAEHSSGTPSDSTSTSSVDSTAQVVEAPTSRTPIDSAPDRDNRSLGQKLDDARLEARARQALVGTPALRVFDFRLRAVGDHVTLAGDVNTPDQYRTAEQTVARVAGVDSVTNELTMDGRPVTEERLAAASERDAEEDGDAAVYHTVRRGESLWRIAKRYGTTVQRLRSINGLRGGALRPGQRIRVR